MRVVILLAALVAVPAAASTSGSWTALDKRTSAACLKAAGLKDATAGAPVRFSDNTLIDARVVTGTWPQAHMKGAAGTMLCLYNRRTRAVEVQEMALPVVASGGAPKKDVEWVAQDIDSRGMIDDSRVTLRLGSDGKVTGTSGCNRYSANYKLVGTTLTINPPLIGTRMMCPPAIMKQETRFRVVLEAATLATVDATGALTVGTRDGRRMKFLPAG